MSNAEAIYWTRLKGAKIPTIALKRGAYLQGPDAFLELLNEQGDILIGEDKIAISRNDEITGHTKTLIKLAGEIVSLHPIGAFLLPSGELISTQVSNLGTTHMSVGSLSSTTRLIQEDAAIKGINGGTQIFQCDGEIPLVFSSLSSGKLDAMVQPPNTNWMENRSLRGPGLELAHDFITFTSNRLETDANERELFPAYIMPRYLVTSILANLAPIIKS